MGAGGYGAADQAWVQRVVDPPETFRIAEAMARIKLAVERFARLVERAEKLVAEMDRGGGPTSPPRGAADQKGYWR